MKSVYAVVPGRGLLEQADLELIAAGRVEIVQSLQKFLLEARGHCRGDSHRGSLPKQKNPHGRVWSAL